MSKIAYGVGVVGKFVSIIHFLTIFARIENQETTIGVHGPKSIVHITHVRYVSVAQIMAIKAQTPIFFRLTHLNDNFGEVSIL
jgi:hypothetical protein